MKAESRGPEVPRPAGLLHRLLWEAGRQGIQVPCLGLGGMEAAVMIPGLGEWGWALARGLSDAGAMGSALLPPETPEQTTSLEFQRDTGSTCGWPSLRPSEADKDK